MRVIGRDLLEISPIAEQPWAGGARGRVAPFKDYLANAEEDWSFATSGDDFLVSLKGCDLTDAVAASPWRRRLRCPVALSLSESAGVNAPPRFTTAT